MLDVHSDKSRSPRRDLLNHRWCGQMERRSASNGKLHATLTETGVERERERIGFNIWSSFPPAPAFLCPSVPDKLRSTQRGDVLYPWPQPQPPPPSPSETNQRSRLLQVLAALCWQPVTGLRRFCTTEISFAIQSLSPPLSLSFSLSLSRCSLTRTA